MFGLAYLAVALAAAIRFGEIPFHRWAARLSDSAPEIALPLLLAWAPAGFAVVALAWIGPVDRAAPPAARRRAGGRAGRRRPEHRLGAVGAWLQDDLEHVVGYSILQDAGFVMLGLAILDPSAWQPTRTWILVFVVVKTAFAAWAVAVRTRFGTRRIPDLDGWARRSPGLAIALAPDRRRDDRAAGPGGVGRPGPARRPEHERRADARSSSRSAGSPRSPTTDGSPWPARGRRRSWSRPAHRSAQPPGADRAARPNRGRRVRRARGRPVRRVPDDVARPVRDSGAARLGRQPRADRVGRGARPGPPGRGRRGRRARRRRTAAAAPAPEPVAADRDVRPGPDGAAVAGSPSPAGSEAPSVSPGETGRASPAPRRRHRREPSAAAVGTEPVGPEPSGGALGRSTGRRAVRIARSRRRAAEPAGRAAIDPTGSASRRRQSAGASAQRSMSRS